MADTSDALTKAIQLMLIHKGKYLTAGDKKLLFVDYYTNLQKFETAKVIKAFMIWKDDPDKSGVPTCKQIEDIITGVSENPEMNNFYYRHKNQLIMLVIREDCTQNELAIRNKNNEYWSDEPRENENGTVRPSQIWERYTQFLQPNEFNNVNIERAKRGLRPFKNYAENPGSGSVCDEIGY